MKRNLANAKEKSAAVDVEIQQYAINIKSLQKEKMQERSILDNHAKGVGPALRVLESNLKMRVEGVKRKRVSNKLSGDLKVFRGLASYPIYAYRPFGPSP